MRHQPPILEEQMLTNRPSILFVACASVVFFGCNAISKSPNPALTNDLNRADSILLQQEGEVPVRLTDADEIKRLCRIYVQSRWIPASHVFPATLGQRRISICQGDTVLRTFAYNETLWESGAYTYNRKAKLSEADREWLESLFLLE